MTPAHSSSLAGKRILITGASGFIGSNLCQSLCGIGAEVHGVSRIPRAGIENKPRWWKGDLSDPATVRNLVSLIKPDLIFHLAAGDTRAKRDLNLVLPILQNNLAPTINILTVATEIGCGRIVLAGSLDEPEPGDIPSSPYAASHAAIQAYSQMFYRVFDTPLVTARMFMAYGHDQEAVQKLIPYVTLSLLQGQSPQVSSGQRLVDWIYIDDLVEGLIALAEAKGVEGSVVDLGSGILTSVRDVAKELARLAGAGIEPEMGALPDRPLEPQRTARVNETYSRIGWKARTPLEKGLTQTIDWYREKLKSGMRKAAVAGGS
jgi:UDP-glucose 4-epimerase